MADGGTVEAGDTAAATPAEPAVSRDTSALAAPAEPAAPAEGAAPAEPEGGEKAGEKTGEKPAGAPEKYEAFQLPEGVQLDQVKVDEFQPLAKELNLTQEQAQKLVDFYAKTAQEQATNHVKAWNQLLDARLAETKADPEIGGANFEKTVADARIFLKEFGTPALQDYLNTSDAANHVEVLRAFAKAGRALSDDKFVPASGSAPAQPKTIAQILYPNLP